jgi:hypothetical protein
MEGQSPDEILSKDNIRVILVKTGFIGNDIDNMAEIQNDEAMLDEIWAILKGNDTGKVSPYNLQTLCGIMEGFICPVYQKDYDNEQYEDVIQEEGVGIFNKNGQFVLKSKSEQSFLVKKFARLAANRNKFVRDRIKEKQIEKNKPTETFMPTINKKSALIVQRKIELANSQTGVELMIGSDPKTEEEMHKLAQSKSDEMASLSQAIHDIKAGNYKAYESKSSTEKEYQSPSEDQKSNPEMYPNSKPK